MKGRVLIALGATLGIVLAGCQRPTEPTYSPDGRILAYADGTDLRLRVGREDRSIGQVTGSVAWSPDGTRLAFEEDEETVILDLRSNKRVVAEIARGPYAWQGALLTAVKSIEDKGTCTLYSLRGDTGATMSRNELSFVPDDMWSVPGGLLLRMGRESCFFDGYAPIPLPQLSGWSPVGPLQGSGMIMSKMVVESGVRQAAVLSGWSGNPFDPPTELRRLNLSDAVGAHMATADLLQATPDGRVAALLATAYRGATREADDRIKEIVAGYGLISESPREMPEQVSKELDSLLERATWEFWAIVWREDGSWKKWPVAAGSHLALNPQGTTLAVVGDDGPRFLRATKP